MIFQCCYFAHTLLRSWVASGRGSPTCWHRLRTRSAFEYRCGSRSWLCSSKPFDRPLCFCKVRIESKWGTALRNKVNHDAEGNQKRTVVILMTQGFRNSLYFWSALSFPYAPILLGCNRQLPRPKWMIWSILVVKMWPFLTANFASKLKDHKSRSKVAGWI